jgi:hypothetical protein
MKYAVKMGSGDMMHIPSFTKIGLKLKKKLRGLVRQRTIPTELPPLVGEASANFRE